MRFNIVSLMCCNGMSRYGTIRRLAAITSIKQLDPTWLRAAAPVSGTDAMSQFPYFEQALRRKALP